LLSRRSTVAEAWAAGIRSPQINVDAEGRLRPAADPCNKVAVDLKLSELVDVPNFVVSAFLPLDTFGS
jgi:hypothetical protein